MSVLFVIYGYRLGGYILKRELTNAAYRKTLESTGSTKKAPASTASLPSAPTSRTASSRT